MNMARQEREPAGLNAPAKPATLRGDIDLLIDGVLGTRVEPGTGQVLDSNYTLRKAIGHIKENHAAARQKRTTSQ